jgi:hypothetical protein
VDLRLNNTSSIEFATTSGSPTIQTTTVRSGTYAGRISSLSSTTAKFFRYDFNSGNVNGPLFFRAFVRFATLPSAENRFIALRTSGNTPMIWFTIDNSGVLRLYDEDGQITGTVTLSTNNMVSS